MKWIPDLSQDNTCIFHCQLFTRIESDKFSSIYFHCQVDRISCKNLSVQDFKEHFVKRGIPVILEDVVSSMAEENWDLDHIKEKAGGS